MKKGYADVTVILDRSGSMSSIRTDTIGGFNTFIEEQKNAEGECKVTLIQFDSVEPFEVVRNAVDVTDMPPLDEQTYQPRGGTPLYDAIGRAIGAAGDRFRQMAEDQRPEHVVFAIITDGMENQSREFTRDSVFNLIKEQTEKWKWHFVYLGANQDAMQEGGKIGTSAANSMDFSHTGQGIARAYGATSANLKAMRSGNAVDMSYTDQQRAEAKS